MKPNWKIGDKIQLLGSNVFATLISIVENDGTTRYLMDCGREGVHLLEYHNLVDPIATEDWIRRNGLKN